MLQGLPFKNKLTQNLGIDNFTVELKNVKLIKVYFLHLNNTVRRQHNTKHS